MEYNILWYNMIWYVLSGVEGFAVQTEGVNFEAVWALSSSLIQANEIKCNDIHRMLHTFGVEAARASIVTEVQGTYVRHYSTLFYTMPYSAELSLHCTLLYFAG